jgi:hypothetical protein
MSIIILQAVTSSSNRVAYNHNPSKTCLVLGGFANPIFAAAKSRKNFWNQPLCDLLLGEKGERGRERGLALFGVLAFVSPNPVAVQVISVD